MAQFLARSQQVTLVHRGGSRTVVVLSHCLLFAIASVETGVVCVKKPNASTITCGANLIDAMRK